jgi:hypothetical protein
MTDSTSVPLSNNKLFDGAHNEWEEIYRSLFISSLTGYELAILRKSERPNDASSKELVNPYMLMALYFPARFVKPNILVFLSVLARVRNPTEFHMRHLKHVYGFVRNTIDQKIKIKPSSARVGASIDSAFGLHQDGYSQSAMVLTVGQAPVGFYTNKQSTIATSSTEAETNALMDGIPRIKWARGLLEELGYLQDGPSEVSQDNMANIHLSSPDLPCSFRRTKHNIIKCAFIREQHTDGIIKAVQVPTDTISSDLLTKLVCGPSIPEKTDRLFGYLPTI